MSERAVLLDLDGLLIDTERMVLAAFNAAAAELDQVLSPALFRSLIGRTARESEALLRSAFPSDSAIATFRAATQRYYEQDVEENGIALMAGAEELLEFLDERKMQFACATSSGNARAWWKLEQAGIAHRFRTLVGGDEVAAGKPSPDIFIEAAARLGTDPKRCIALEDSLDGLAAASAAGVTPIMVPDLIEPDEVAFDLAYAIVDDLHEACRVIAALSD